MVSSNVNQNLQRVSDVPIYMADALVRRATSLQLTRDASAPCMVMHGNELKARGLKSGDMVKVMQGQASITLAVMADDSMPASVGRVPAGHPATAELGAMFGTLVVERV